MGCPQRNHMHERCRRHPCGDMLICKYVNLVLRTPCWSGWISTSALMRLPVWNWLGCGDFQQVPYIRDCNSQAHLGPSCSSILWCQCVGHCSHFTTGQTIASTDFCSPWYTAQRVLIFSYAESPSLLRPVIDLRSLRDERAVHILPVEASHQQAIVATCIGRWNHDSSPGSEETRKKYLVRDQWPPGVGGPQALATSRNGKFVEHSAECATFSSKSGDQHAVAENQSVPFPTDPARHLVRCCLRAIFWKLVGFCSEWETHHRWDRILFWNSASLKRGKSVRNRSSLRKQWPLSLAPDRCTNTSFEQT